MGIGERYAKVSGEVQGCCEEAERTPGSVKLVAVSKTVDVDGARAAFEAGARDFGENRPDQIVEKAAAIPDARWHFIGNIQSRRIPDIVASSWLIHSLCKREHGEKIDRAAARFGKVQDVLVEVNVSGEESKSGTAPDDARDLVAFLESLDHVRVRGLMTMAPRGDEASAVETFRGLADLAEDIRASMAPEAAAEFTELSMGMSEDWPSAIACGSTMVRIGRAIFSDDFKE